MAEPLWKDMASAFDRLTACQVRDKLAMWAVRTRAQALIKAEEALGAPCQAIMAHLPSPPNVLPELQDVIAQAALAPVDPEHTLVIEELFIRPHCTRWQRISRALPLPTFTSHPLAPDLSDVPIVIPKTPSLTRRLLHFLPQRFPARGPLFASYFDRRCRAKFSNESKVSRKKKKM